MKKIISIITTLALLTTIFSTTVLAEDYTKYADKLSELDLFKGTTNGYELDKTLTREEGATMLVRLLGEEKTVKKSSFSPHFADVEENRWSFPYVMYCYENNITHGTGENTFSPSDTISANEFVTLVLRALGYAETEPETAFDTAVKNGLFGSSFAADLKKSNEFLRNDMVYISYRSLQTKTADGEVLAKKLHEKNILTQSQADEFDIFALENINDFLDKYLQ